MKRIAVILLVVGAISAPFWLFPARSFAIWTTGGCNWQWPAVCGYFFGGNHENADCNVLPGASDCNLGDTSKLFNDADYTSFVNDIGSYVNNMNGGNAWNSGSNIDTHGRVGAAFIIDAMFGIDYNNGSRANAVSHARTRFNEWKALVKSFSDVASCTNAGQIRCANTNQGVNWSYTPPSSQFCADKPTLNTAWDPSAQDVAIAPSHDGSIDGVNGDGDLTLCTRYWNDMKPEIVFWWNDGANTFRIGKKCGNVVQSATPLPIDQTPTGSISLACDAATSQQIATVTFDDPDGATVGHITTGSYTSGDVNSGNNIQITIPISATDPYTAQAVQLHVTNTGPGGASDVVVASANTAVPCVSVGCNGLTTDPGLLDPYMSFTLTVNVKLGNGVTSPPPGANVSVKITPPAGASYNYNSSKAPSFDPATAVISAAFSPLGPTNKTGQYKVDWTLTGSGINQSCSSTFNVVYLPYVNVYGGDVTGGASPAGGGSCSVNSAAGAFSWNNYKAGFSGAGSEYAVLTLAQIDEFGSAIHPSSSTAPKDLSFANSGIPASKLDQTQGMFGGFFGDNSGQWACGRDYTSGLGNPVNGNVTINSHSVASGTQEIHYVSGHNVYITGDVTYGGSGGWANVKDIPVFKVVVTGGNIYIDSSVAQLDGLFVAEQSGGNGGQIITCATNGGGVWKPVDPTVNGFYTTCSKKLTINGAFVAQDVLFGRTNGSVGQAKTTDDLNTNHDAEVFNYTPELWLPRSATTPSDTYDSITALPPVL